MPKFEIYFSRVFTLDAVVEVEAESGDRARRMVDSNPAAYAPLDVDDLTEFTPDVHVIKELTE